MSAQERVNRLIGELSWDFHENHGFEIFALRQSDHSPAARPGQIVDVDDEDEVDARLTWVGARLMGVFELSKAGLLGYWLDGGLVRGSEQLVEYDEISRDRSEVGDRSRRDVSGWAVDVGLNWHPALAWEPRLFAGYAYGSGDSDPDSNTDRSYRQTDLQSNEPGFGGVERFVGYGGLLDPELSNLGIVTIGVGISLFQSSSLDLVYHHFRQPKRADFLRDSLLETELTGTRRDVGQEIDLVIALEEWEHLEFQLVGAAFRAGRAFGKDDGTWAFGGFFAMRIAF